MENSPETSPEFLKKLWKIFFIFQQIEKGWTVKKKDNNKYEFTKDVDTQSREFTF
tara:strand:+ start:763 stop:927 length:165 start_codon:yes stop_codon:yes gene_type:complete